MKENLKEYCLQVGRKDEPFNYTLQMVEQGAISREELLQARHDGIIDDKVFALGGITFSRIEEVKALGFGGAMILGDAWKKSPAPTHSKGRG